jgi:hypothetical protein
LIAERAGEARRAEAGHRRQDCCSSFIVTHESERLPAVALDRSGSTLSLNSLPVRDKWVMSTGDLHATITKQYQVNMHTGNVSPDFMLSIRACKRWFSENPF